jgi:hypothetical protein
LKIDKWLSKQLGYSAYNINSANVRKLNFFKFKSKNVLISIKSNKKFKNTFLKKNKIRLIQNNLTFLKISKKKKSIIIILKI